VLLRETDAGITKLTLNRPSQYNALSRETLTALKGVLNDIETDETVRVVIIAARGKAFCAGHDLKEMRTTTDRAAHQALFELCGEVMLTVNRMPQPIIAQVQGIATAAGCQLVAACDLAVAAEDARFAVSGINLGLFCSTPAVALSRNLGRKRALEMLLTGELIDAPAAREYGLVNRVVPASQLEEATWALASVIGAKSPVAINLGKRVFYQQLEMTQEQAYHFASEQMACNLAGEDAREGIDAFIAKRKPRWRGR
jgi:enoyl-CoA hydratase/carnithine racemase